MVILLFATKSFRSFVQSVRSSSIFNNFSVVQRLCDDLRHLVHLSAVHCVIPNCLLQSHVCTKTIILSSMLYTVLKKMLNLTPQLLILQFCCVKILRNFTFGLIWNLYRRDTCFDAHLFQRLFCLYHVMLCARSDDVTVWFFVCK